MRSPKKRSLLGVNELFEGKRNAEITLLDGFFLFEALRPPAYFNFLPSEKSLPPNPNRINRAYSGQAGDTIARVIHT